MTVLVIDQKNKIMASDSAATSYQQVIVQKVHQLEDGTLIGFCGTIVSALKFLEWYIDGADKANPPKFDKAEGNNSGDSVVAYVLNDAGLFCYETSCYGYQVFDSLVVDGSGQDAAKAAIAMGADVKKAIEIACAVCKLHCCLPVQIKKYRKRKTKAEQ